MATTLPANTTKANFDAGTDDPKQARSEFVTNADIQNSLKDALGGLAQLSNPAGSGLEEVSQVAGTPDDVRVFHKHERKVADYLAVAGDRSKLIEFDSGSAIILNLTAAATLSNGWFINVNNSGAGTLTIDPNGAETIDDAATITLSQNQSAIIFCDGVSFWTVGKNSVSATKEFIVSFLAKGTAFGYANGVGDFVTANIDVNEQVKFSFFVPNDYISLVEVVIMVLPDTTETLQWDALTDFGADGESRTANSDTVINATKSVTIDTIAELVISGAFTAIAAGDWVGVDFQSDTTTIHPVALRFKYL